MVKEKIRWQSVNADLHTHLKTGSDFSHIDFNRVINLARTRLGKGGIVGLTNFEDDRYEQFIERPGYERINLGNAIYVPKREILVVKGQEIPTRECHILVLGLEQGISLRSGLPLGNTLNDAKERDLAVILPHPGSYQGILKEIDRLSEFTKRVKEGAIFDTPNFLSQRVHGIEIYNSEQELGFPKYADNNRVKSFQKVMAQWFDFGAVANSDGHSIRELGRSYTELIIARYEHMADKDSVKSHLKKAIGSAKKFQGKREPAKLGAIEHVVALAYYILRDKLQI